jgi:hypothetical protein
MPKQLAAYVRFGSKADIGVSPIDVRFTPKSGHQPTYSITSWREKSARQCGKLSHADGPAMPKALRNVGQ